MFDKDGLGEVLLVYGVVAAWLAWNAYQLAAEENPRAFIMLAMLSGLTWFVTMIVTHARGRGA